MTKVRKNDELAGIGQVRVIDDRGQMLGVMPVAQALEIARARGLDLVEVDAEVTPPVCKILDFAKFDYAAARGAARRRNT
jgi:translation initiation factor IF-3